MHRLVADGVRMNLSALPVAVVLSAIVFFAAKVRTENVTLAFVTFLGDVVTTPLERHLNVALTFLAFDSFEALLDAVVTAIRESELDFGQTFVVQMI